MRRPENQRQEEEPERTYEDDNNSTEQ
jgi:hypothetical protein